jgi:hypothetical protein
MIAFDPSYEPRHWRCERCRHILGVVMRDQRRVRHLWIFGTLRTDETVPPTVILLHAPRGLFSVHAADQCDVECAGCGQINCWDLSKDALYELLRRRAGRFQYRTI